MTHNDDEIRRYWGKDYNWKKRTKTKSMGHEGNMTIEH